MGVNLWLDPSIRKEKKREILSDSIDILYVKLFDERVDEKDARWEIAQAQYFLKLCKKNMADNTWEKVGKW